MYSSQIVSPLKITADIFGKKETVYPTLVHNNERAVLVDTAFPGQQDLILDAISELGIPKERISAILLTHQDIDHIGCVDALRESIGVDIVVCCMSEERPFIEGPELPLKLTDESIERILASLPPAFDAEKKAFLKSRLQNPPRPRVDISLAHKERREEFGNLTAIATPGHTPGHASYYHEASKTLIAGDALRVENGELYGPIPELCHDYASAIRSLRVLESHHIDTIICHHGGTYRGDIPARISQIIEEESLKLS